MLLQKSVLGGLLVGWLAGWLGWAGLAGWLAVAGEGHARDHGHFSLAWGLRFFPALRAVVSVPAGQLAGQPSPFQSSTVQPSPAQPAHPGQPSPAQPSQPAANQPANPT